MLGLDFLMAGTLLTLAASQPAANPCPHVKTAEISVIPSAKDVTYDYSKTMAQLQATKTDTINPYGFHGVTMTQGYMEGEIRMQPTIKLDHKYDQRIGAVCIWYDQVTLPIQISPTIVIAREVYNDPCMRKAVIDHEMKHVQADRKIVNKYAGVMGKKIYAALKERGFRAQPVAPEHAQAMADRMTKVVSQVIDQEYKRMELDRMEAQNAIDNVEEYNGVSAQCPDFKPPTNVTSKKKNR